MYDIKHRFVNERMKFQQGDKEILIASNITKMFDLGFGRMLKKFYHNPTGCRIVNQ